MIRHGVYIGSLVIILTIIGTSTNNEIELVTYWALIGLIVEIPLFLYIILLVRKSFTLKFDYFRILKYLISSVIIFGSIYFIMEEFLIYNESIFEFLPILTAFVFLGGLGYLGITYVIDQNTRKLVKSILKEIKGKRTWQKKII